MCNIQYPSVCLWQVSAAVCTDSAKHTAHSICLTLTNSLNVVYQFNIIKYLEGIYPFHTIEYPERGLTI